MEAEGIVNVAFSGGLNGRRCASLPVLLCWLAAPRVGAQRRERSADERTLHCTAMSTSARSSSSAAAYRTQPHLFQHFRNTRLQLAAEEVSEQHSATSECLRLERKPLS